ncbi:FKBP-type peptidyl-prolyl cis-trans isomerase [Oleiagrimonas citrea]|uniref:Peptidyl-prolyl cis-trans isomerase n=2 Tax=Rhodanobacteraceae TaxID=1775411 RepID=A0A846ZJK4_9GAMM|nr:FKBP-type peptidyl-prolyl cis-trans isomerase [Oleiagrimonas citrea]
MILRAGLLGLLLSVAACKAPPKPAMHGQVDKLTVIDRSVGTGKEARPGMDVLVQYTGWLYDDRKADKHGTQFDTSRTRSAPFSFVLGEGQVIPGWDQGVAGMRVGGKRTLLIPASLAYGARGAGGGVIPPNASLVFNIELVDAQPR